MTTAITNAQSRPVHGHREQAEWRVASGNAVPEVTLRRFPFPYRAALAICSDLDETPDRATFIETSRFLNTTAATAFGDGLGLEVGNTIYFDMRPDQFAYWNADDRGRAEVRALIRSGHVDCLHSFGDLATTRAHAGRALDELTRHGCSLDVWIDHAVAPTNFGADIMQGSGDVQGAAAYHADLTCAFGVRHVWRGRITSVIGQGVLRRLGGIFDAAHASASARTLVKEAAKGVIARAGSAKYALHAGNALSSAASLRSGQAVYEFLRANPHWGGVSSHDTAAGIGDVLVAPMLNRLIAREGACVLYTHLGKGAASGQPFTAAGARALARLADSHRTGRILVTTTSRLLNYWLASQHATWSATQHDRAVHIHLATPRGATRFHLQGLTFYVDDPSRTRLFVDGEEEPYLARNPADESGRASVSLPWHPLRYPEL